ncbi:tetratricopeptide repeat protein [Thermococcus waiotapuensis]|uniref:Tetratricopeptide repeat protein n=1 Tax=Thermococcus waiotapuensis TaxID=90909 RepID=A0AAE4T3J0_9EURY|nr:tetratricopeptide repeat protein [Thermococcus waiotapuensis]MDV3103853.1 tetratricopeptide repeat protein [Thermococcus waiotapuensis]
MEKLEGILHLASRGLFDEALEEARKLEDPFDRVDALLEIAIKASGINGMAQQRALGEAVELLRKIKDPYYSAYLSSKVAHVYSLLGDYDTASEFFEVAIDEIARIKDIHEQVMGVCVLAHYLARSGFFEEALARFNEAFELAVSAGIDYRSKIDLLIDVASIMENTADVLDSKDAIEFYKTAYDIFDKLHIGQRAADVEKKLSLARTVYFFGTPEIRKALLEGRYHYAVSLLEKSIKDPQDLFIALLEVSAWVKTVGSPEYLDILGAAFRLFDRIGLSEKNVQRAAVILTTMGELERALEFAMKILDPVKRDEALESIALKLAERKDFSEAFEVAAMVSDPKKKGVLVEKISELKKKLEEEF